MRKRKEGTSKESLFIDIKGLGKAKVLTILFNAATNQKRPFEEQLEVLFRHETNNMQKNAEILPYSKTKMSQKDAEDILQKSTKFKFVGETPLSVDLSGDRLDLGFYKEDNGTSALKKAISGLNELKVEQLQNFTNTQESVDVLGETFTSDI